MAGVDFNVVFLDGGSGSGGSSSGGPSSSGTTSRPSPGGPSEPTQGPRKPEREQGPKKDRDTTGELGKGIRQLADLSGAGPLVSSLDRFTAVVGSLGSIYQGVGGIVPKNARSPMGLPPWQGPVARAAGSAAGPAAAEASALGMVAGPAAVAVAAFAAALVAGGVAIKKTADALHEEGRRIQGYSGELTAAYAMSSIRSEMADLRRAQRIGPDAAKVENMRSEFNSHLQDLQTEFYEHAAKVLIRLSAFLPAAERGIDILSVLARASGQTLEALAAKLEKEAIAANGAASAILTGVNGILGIKIREGDKDVDIRDPFMDELLAIMPGGFEAIRERDGKRLPRAAPPGMPPAGAGPGRLEAWTRGAAAATGFGAGGFF